MKKKNLNHSASLRPHPELLCVATRPPLSLEPPLQSLQSLLTPTALHLGRHWPKIRMVFTGGKEEAVLSPVIATNLRRLAYAHQLLRLNCLLRKQTQSDGALQPNLSRLRRPIFPSLPSRRKSSRRSSDPRTLRHLLLRRAVLLSSHPQMAHPVRPMLTAMGRHRRPHQRQMEMVPPFLGCALPVFRQNPQLHQSHRRCARHGAKAILLPTRPSPTAPHLPRQRIS